MSDLIDTAVILAAGLGTRLNELGKDFPKGFLEVGPTSLIERSCTLLADNGIKRILIGTGFHADIYEAFSRAFQKASLTCIYNQHYSTTGSAGTLNVMREAIDRPFLLLESDILYESRAIPALLARQSRAIVTILSSGFTHSEDEVYIETDDKGLVRGISKDPKKLTRLDAEMTGISRWGLSALDSVCRLMDQDIYCRKLHYEDLLSSLSSMQPIDILKIDDLIWCEIDNLSQLERAKTKILSQII